MRYFDAATIRAALPWPRMLDALGAMLREDVSAPLRAFHEIDLLDAPSAGLLMMPAWRTGRRIGVKLVTVFPGNRDRGARAVNAVYALFDARNGAVLALFDGEEITACRTAGASAYAAGRLARKDARHREPEISRIFRCTKGAPCSIVRRLKDLCQITRIAQFLP